MKIIRDEELFGIMMIPLWVDWSIRRCNHAGCRNVPTTIIVEIEGHPGLRLGQCEVHYQKALASGRLEDHFEFDDFDAFRSSEHA